MAQEPIEIILNTAIGIHKREIEQRNEIIKQLQKKIALLESEHEKAQHIIKTLLKKVKT